MSPTRVLGGLGGRPKTAVADRKHWHRARQLCPPINDLHKLGWPTTDCSSRSGGPRVGSGHRAESPDSLRQTILS